MKRLEWAREHLENDFKDVVWTDETSVNLKLTGAFVAVRMDKNHVASHAPSTKSKYMYGLESAGEVARRFAYL